ERLDYSCALFDGNGELVAQGAHMPVHLGSMPLAVAAAIAAHDMEEGDQVLVNDPFAGGTHLPDLTLVQPVFIDDGEPFMYVANRAHHSDVGGMTPGSMPLSESVFQEGIRIPPVKLVSHGIVVPDLMNLILTNVRTPEERSGDLTAQIASNRIGERRIAGMVRRYGRTVVAEYAGHVQDYAEEMTRSAIAAIPDGRYEFEDFMDDDGVDDGPFTIRVAVSIDGSSATVDFAGTDPQVRGCVNANYAITLSAVMYCFRVIIPFDVPANRGTLRPLTVLAPAGSLVNARVPAAVAGGNVETSQRIVDTVLGALSQALPEVVPAASSGTMNNFTFGGIDPDSGSEFAYYETIAGGMGARRGADGMNATHTHMTNSQNTPVEALEHSYPVRVQRYEIARGTGGLGRTHGGDGITRAIEFLVPASVTILSDRRKRGPWGLSGGADGTPGENQIVKSNSVEALPSKCSVDAAAGDVISIRTPGGGGYGTD
ncbi:MAG: hydantoinase B/oxoprolinase family protein, partial [Gemmatimonadales bacterium]